MVAEKVIKIELGVNSRLLNLAYLCERAANNAMTA